MVGLAALIATGLFAARTYMLALGTARKDAIGLESAGFSSLIELLLATNDVPANQQYKHSKMVLKHPEGRNGFHSLHQTP